MAHPGGGAEGAKAPPRASLGARGAKAPPENLKAFFAMLNFIEKPVNATKFWGDEQKKGHQLFWEGIFYKKNFSRENSKNFLECHGKVSEKNFCSRQKNSAPPPEQILRAPLIVTIKIIRKTKTYVTQT